MRQNAASSMPLLRPKIFRGGKTPSTPNSDMPEYKQICLPTEDNTLPYDQFFWYFYVQYTGLKLNNNMIKVHHSDLYLGKKMTEKFL